MRALTAVVAAVDGLVRELRATGLRISLSEHIDAARAVSEVGAADQEMLRSVLRTTLVKDPTHLGAFDLVFDLYFAEAATAVPVGDQQAGAEVHGMASLSDSRLREVLTAAIRDDDDHLLRRVVEVVVDRHAGFEPGRAVAGTLYRLRTLRAIDPEAIRTALRPAESGSPPTMTRLHRRTESERLDESLLRLERSVDAEVRRRLVADRGADDVARVSRRPLPEDVDFLRAASAEVDAVRAAIQPMAVKLASGLTAKRLRRARGVLDVRRTLRAALSTGGVAVHPAYRPRRRAKPRLVVLADISGSVATFAGFTLQLVYALRTEFADVRCFVFVDGIDEVTDVFAAAGDLGEVTRTLNERASGVLLDGQSDYGAVLESFRERFGAELTTRSTVLLLGDGRSNYREARPEALASIAARAGRVYWLNPEPRAAWDSGDSVIARYASHCDGVVECRSVRQLGGFVESL